MVEDFDVQELPPARASGLPGGRGVTVTRITDHGAADQAGLKVGDIVLRIGKGGGALAARRRGGAGGLQGRGYAADARPPLGLRLLDGILAAVMGS